MIVLEQFQGEKLPITGGQPNAASKRWGARGAAGALAGGRDAYVCGRIAPEYALTPAIARPTNDNQIPSEPAPGTGSRVRY